MRIFWAVGLAAVACGNHAAPPPPRRDATTIVVPDSATLELAPHTLGLPDLEAYNWRKRPGQPAFRTARKAEGREDWPNVVVACKQALAADPGHLEAAWLLAVAKAKTGSLDAVTGPLATAVAGDFGKWAIASLEQPALEPYLATPVGGAWRRRVDADRALYAAALARSVIVTAAGDVYAVDQTSPPRWYRLTRTYGGVIAAFAASDGRHVAYVTRTRGRGNGAMKLGAGVVDLATGRSSRPVDLVAPATIAWSTAKPAGFWIGERATSRLLDVDGAATATKQKRPSGPWIDVTIGGGVHVHRLPVAGISADWDDQSLASAIKLASSNRVVTVPSPGVIDGNTIVWSPDRAHVAFVAQTSDHCSTSNTVPAPNSAAFVADVATGTVTELERASGGIAIVWLAERELAIAGDHGVSVVELGGTPVKVDGATGVATPRRKPRCLPDVADEPVTSDDDPPESGDLSIDAGTGK